MQCVDLGGRRIIKKIGSAYGWNSPFIEGLTIGGGGVANCRGTEFVCVRLDFTTIAFTFTSPTWLLSVSLCQGRIWTSLESVWGVGSLMGGRIQWTGERKHRRWVVMQPGIFSKCILGRWNCLIQLGAQLGGVMCHWLQTL